jgi:membrane protein
MAERYQDDASKMISTFRNAFKGFSENDCLTLAASLAYYTLFAMPPLLFLLVAIVSAGMSAAYEHDAAEENARNFLEKQASHLIGNEAAAAEVGTIIENSRKDHGSWWKSLLSLLGVVVGATGLVTALQSSLNEVWRVKPAEGAFAMQFLWKRLLSLAMILGFGFLLLVSFVLSTVLSLLTKYAAEHLALTSLFSTLIDQGVSVLLTWVCFTSIFRFMPDARVSWRNAIIGGFVTVLLFAIGRTALFYYLSTANPGKELGSAAGSLVVILLWVYYSAITLLFGAEFTAALDHAAVKPEPGAVRVEEYTVAP